MGLLRRLYEAFVPPKVQASGIIILGRTKILLCRRSSWMDNYPGYWSIPGGHVEEGESLKTAAIRETWEETQIKIPEDDVVFLTTLKKSKTDFHIFLYKNYKYSTPKLNEEHDAWGYYSINRLPQPIDGDLRRLLKKVYEDK